jgi:cytochrome c oxidase assembly factor CtaG
MSLRTLALDWSLDGPVGTAFLVLVAGVAAVYLAAAAHGSRRDRRGRSWPRRRSACFIAGLGLLVVDLYSGIGTGADVRLSTHMLEHMIMWVVVAPLLAAGAPVRLAFFSLPRPGRRVLAQWLHSRPVDLLTRPLVSVALFGGVLLITHIPAVYGLALQDDYVHEAEHGTYLLTAVIMWAPLLGVDPLPHRPGPRAQAACMVGCMVPMALIAVWLATAGTPVYDHYLGGLGTAALHDQRLAATIMWVAGLPAFAMPALIRWLAPAAARYPGRVSVGARA